MDQHHPAGHQLIWRKIYWNTDTDLVSRLQWSSISEWSETMLGSRKVLLESRCWWWSGGDGLDKWECNRQNDRKAVRFKGCATEVGKKMNMITTELSCAVVAQTQMADEWTQLVLIDLRHEFHEWKCVRAHSMGDLHISQSLYIAEGHIQVSEQHSMLPLAASF